MASLLTYGSEDKLEASSFPSAFDPECFEAWSSYITTQTAYDLYNSAPHPKGMERVIQGFYSSISQYVANPTIKTIPDPQKESLDDLRRATRAYWQQLTIWLNRIQFNQMFRLADVNTQLDLTTNIVANCVTYTAKSYLTYVPRSREAVGSILHAQDQFWFNGQKPKALFKPSNLSVKHKSGIEVDVYPTLSTIMTSPKAWHTWSDKHGIDIARVKGNAVCLQIESSRMMCFLMRKKPHEVQRLIRKTIGATII